MSFYYNSITNIVIDNITTMWKLDDALRAVQNDIRFEMICQYRNIFNVYSQTWTPIYKIHHIVFSTHLHIASPSIRHCVHTSVVIRLLREWIQRIHSVIDQLDKKFN